MSELLTREHPDAGEYTPERVPPTSEQIEAALEDLSDKIDEIFTPELLSEIPMTMGKQPGQEDPSMEPRTVPPPPPKQ